MSHTNVVKSLQIGAGPTGHRKLPDFTLQAARTQLSIWATRSSQRRALASLDDRTLKDIGITRIDALQEARKLFWQE